MFDGKSINMDVCPRSGSADSLRTTGHSRSVSHDSYFDLLQSPLRGLVTCPSRELSELGINFDREEPEMRIFSESESLVSSPKVAKEVNYLVGGFFSRFQVIFLFFLLVSSTNDTCATRRLCQ
jgi:Rho GTPase-activating protein 32